MLEVEVNDVYRFSITFMEILNIYSIKLENLIMTSSNKSEQVYMAIKIFYKSQSRVKFYMKFSRFFV